VGLRCFPHLAEEVRGQRHLSPGGTRGLQNDGRHVVARRQGLAQAGRIVRRQQDGLLDKAGRNTGRHSAVEVRHGARRDAVVPAVEVPEEADDLRLAGVGAGEPQREM
jgi:hypothetical protein